jgi:hypothetical protein
LEIEISEEELRRRLTQWKPPRPRYPFGVFAKYAARGSSASEGAITKPGRQCFPGTVRTNDRFADFTNNFKLQADL